MNKSYDKMIRNNYRIVCKTIKKNDIIKSDKSILQIS